MVVDMGTTDLMKKSSRVTSVLCFVLLGSLSTNSSAADIELGVEAGASYTDNVTLESSPNEQDDLIYQVSPRIRFNHEAPNFVASLDYALDWLRYSDLNETSSYHRGELRLRGMAWEKTFSTEVGVRRLQTLADPNGIIPSGRLPQSENLIDLDETWINPQITRRFGRSVTLDANYRLAKFRYDDPLIQEHENQSGVFSLENYLAGRGVTWAFNYEWRRSEYEISQPWENQQASVEIGFWVSPSTRIFGATGKESSWENPFDPSLEDTFWEAGFAFSKSKKFTAEFAIGERSFGTSWRGRVDYEFRRGVMSFSYEESPTTDRFTNSGSNTSGILYVQELDDFLSRPGSAERYVSGRFDWSVKLEFRSLTMDFSVFDEDRSDRFDAIGTPVDGQSQSGADASVAWRAGARTSFRLYGSVIDQTIGADDKLKLLNTGLSIDYRLGKRTELSLGYNHTDEEPRGQSQRNTDYVANVVSLLFRYTR